MVGKEIMRETPGRTRYIARNTENVKNEKHTLQDLEYVEKIDKRKK